MINWDRIAELEAEVGEDGIHEVIALFIEEVGEAVAEMSEIPDQTGLGERLHFLKGSAQNIGLDGLSALCSQEETALRADKAHQVKLDEIVRAFRQAEEELSSFAG